MNRRVQLWDALAKHHPSSYWVVQSLAFYGSVTLVTEIGNAVGWTSTQPWPAKVLSAGCFGGFMLWMARRRQASVSAAP